jgi:hypothetical protein
MPLAPPPSPNVRISGHSDTGKWEFGKVGLVGLICPEDGEPAASCFYLAQKITAGRSHFGSPCYFHPAGLNSVGN